MITLKSIKKVIMPPRNVGFAKKCGNFLPFHVVSLSVLSSYVSVFYLLPLHLEKHGVKLKDICINTLNYSMESLDKMSKMIKVCFSQEFLY